MLCVIQLFEVSRVFEKQCIRRMALKSHTTNSLDDEVEEPDIKDMAFRVGTIMTRNEEFVLQYIIMIE